MSRAEGSAECIFSGYNGTYMNMRLLFSRLSIRRVARILVFTVFFVSVVSVTSFSFASAETLASGAFIIRPAKVELMLLPGESKTITLTLENGTLSPLLIDMTFEDVAVSPQSSPLDDPIKLLGSDKGAYSLKGMLSSPQLSFDLLSTNVIKVPVTITAPKDALPGGKYGSVVFTVSPSQKSATAPGNIAIKSRLAAIIYLRIGGSAKEEGGVVAFGLFNDAKTVSLPSASDPLRFQVSFENKGDVHLNPYGGLSVKGLLGSEYTVPIDPWAVLPGATRMREINVLDEIPPGYYTAHLELNRGYQNVIDTKEVKFFVLPSARQSFVGFIVLLFLLWFIRRSLQLSRHSV